ncbi:MAG TPA: hypothetical protein PKK06_17840 [Phycisphaerae bacterium]|nr:hypothetical protein [Phycisphaerae bacterium]HNU47079.1 hypothetical protein [Phycisphaerae bacterium]
MQDRGHHRDKLLLELYLGRLDDETRLWLEGELADDAALRSRYERLQRLLKPLDAWTAPEAPTDLADRVLARVRTAAAAGARASTLPPPAAAAPTVLRFPETTADRVPGARGARYSLRDIAAVAACLLLAATVLVPGVTRMRGHAQRMACARNLEALHHGAATYQASFGGLPFAGQTPGAPWLPAAAGVQRPESNSRHVYLILRIDGAQPRHFICPADRRAAPMATETVEHHRDFLTRRNFSYDALQMAGPIPVPGARPRLAYLSDHNPLFVKGRFDDSVDPDETNSPTHNGGGQNVLLLDGSVVWLTTPVYGTERDNLWLIEQLRAYRGTETRPNDADAFLVPGFPETDPEVNQLPRPGSPE